jgi:hypothetical protein
MLAHFGGDFIADPEFTKIAFKGNPNLGSRVTQAVMQFIAKLQSLYSRADLDKGGTKVDHVTRGSTQYLKTQQALESMRTKMGEAFSEMARRAQQKQSLSGPKH